MNTSEQKDHQAESQLSLRQLKLINILADNPNIKCAAAEAGIGRTTAHRWLNDSSFQEELARQRNQLMNHAMNVVQSHTVRAVDELVKLLDSNNEWLKRQTCRDILNYSLKIRSIEAIEKRLLALERQQKETLNESI